MNMETLDLIVRIAIVCTIIGFAVLICPVACSLLADSWHDVAGELRRMLSAHRASRKHNHKKHHTHNHGKGYTTWQLNSILM
jgi:hypothetical protein